VTLSTSRVVCCSDAAVGATKQAWALCWLDRPAHTQAATASDAAGASGANAGQRTALPAAVGCAHIAHQVDTYASITRTHPGPSASDSK
jgi:hypothetical protein